MSGHHGQDGRSERRFERGGLKYVILDLLSEKSRHGYEIIQAISERSAGLYTPSPGSVYPVLQMLEDLGQVTLAQGDGRKIYTLTDTGKAFLADRAEQVNQSWQRAGWLEEPEGSHGWEPDVWQALRSEIRDVGRFFGHRGWMRHLNHEKMARILQVIAKARAEIEQILSE